MAKNDIGGVWRTVGGRRIFIKDGEDLATAMKKSGKFDKNKNNYDNDYEKFAKDHKDRDVLNKKFYIKMRELGLEDEEIHELKNHDIYESGTKEYKTKEEYEKIIERNKKEKEDYKNRIQKDIEKAEIEIKKKEALKKVIIEREGITEKQYEKEEKAARYREKKIEEANFNYAKLGKNQTGYTENGKSVRAVKAEAEGKFPKSEAAKMLGVSPQMIEKYCDKTEWHHSGGTLYNEIDYYDISKYIDIADFGVQDYIDDNDYKEEVKNWKKMTGRK